MISDRELWQRAKPVFDELADMEHDIRQARLKQIARTDPELAAVLERLLDADHASEGALRDYSFGGGSARDRGANSTPPAQAFGPGANAPASRGGANGSSSAHATSTSGQNASRDPLGIIGQTVSHFRVTDYLAAGGMGVVYSAEDLQLARTVALKFPLPHQHLGSAVKQRFENEARSAGSLDHPNLCTIHEIGESEFGLFLAMPLYPGETLKEHLARAGTLEPGAALDIMMQLTQGLASAHVAGIVHRDLKPANVMLLPDGTVKVLDFGLAKIRDVELTASRTTLGTIGYVAPEQVRGESVDARTDLWAVGIMLYEALTGVQPFRGDHEVTVIHAVLNETQVRPSQVNPALSADVDRVIDSLLQKDPADRYQSANALLMDLDSLRRSAPLVARPRYRAPSRLLRRAFGSRTRSAAVVVSTLAIVVMAGAAWRVYARSAAASEAESPVRLSWTGDTTWISNSAELAAAVVPANAGRHVRLLAGEYELQQPLSVPDGMTLEGAGVMQFSSDSLPSGFTDDTRTTIRMAANVSGDFIALGRGTILQRLELVDLAGRSGNVISLVSRQAHDTISSTISHMVIVNPNPHTISPTGALGRALNFVTRNLNLGADPAPDSGSLVSARVVGVLVQSPGGGGGIFAFNFASNSRVVVHLSRSVIGGTNEFNGGVSRPDAVHDSEVAFTSVGNLFRNEWANPCAPAVIGWNMVGGSGAPIPLKLPETTRNRLVFHSTDDRIESFKIGVHATGSRHFFDSSLQAEPTYNHVDLKLIGTNITTPSCSDAGTADNSMGIPTFRSRDVSDLLLIGAWSEEDSLNAGSYNSVRAELRGVTGSGDRSNLFAHTASTSGRLPAYLSGVGNRLEIVGDSQRFANENRSIQPLPPTEYFLNSLLTREPDSKRIPISRANLPTRRTP